MLIFCLWSLLVLCEIHVQWTGSHFDTCSHLEVWQWQLIFLFPALSRLNVGNKDSIPGLIKPSICGQEWVFSPWDGGGKNIWCRWALDVSTCSLLTCIIFFFSNRKTPKFILHKQGRNWTKHITAQMVYIIQFWKSIIKLWCLLTWGKNILMDIWF